MCCNNGTFFGGCQSSISNDGRITTTSFIPVTVESRVVSGNFNNNGSWNNSWNNGWDSSSCGCSRRSCWGNFRRSCCGF